MPPDLSSALALRRSDGTIEGGNAEIDVNEAVDLVATVTNAGSGTGYGNSLTITAPAGLALSPTTACPGSPTSVTCQLPDLAPGATTSITVPATANTPLTSEQVTATVSNLQDPNSSNDSVVLLVSTFAADLAVTMTGSTTSVTLTVTNNGPDTARSVVLTVTPDVDTSLSGFPAGCSGTGATGAPVDCDIASIGIGTGQSASRTLTVTPGDCAASTGRASPHR